MLKNKVFIVILIVLISICSFNFNSYAVSGDTTTIEPQQLEISFNHYAKGDKVVLTDLTSVVIGQTYQLYAFIKQGNSEENSENQSGLNWYVKEIDLNGLAWSSSDSSIATVDNDGKVTGIKEGYVTITASIPSGYTATKQIEVIRGYDPEAPYISIIDEQESSFLGRPVIVGSLKKFYIEFKNVPDTEKNNIEITKNNIKITIADSSIAKVQDIKIDNSRIYVEVEGLKEGSSRIDATLNYEGKTYSAARTFSVYNSLFKLVIAGSNDHGSILVNNTLGLWAGLYYYDEHTSVEGSLWTIEWSSSNENVAKIDKDVNGWYALIRAMGEGKAVITAKAIVEDEIITATYDVEVKGKIEIVPEKDISSIKVNDTVKLNVIFTPATTETNKPWHAVWSSSNEKVAKVDNNGLVTAIGEGEAVIYAELMSTDEFLATATYNIKVEPAEKVIENPTKTPNNSQEEKLPQTGLNEVSVILLIIIIGISIFTYIKYRKYKNIF